MNHNKTLLALTRARYQLGKTNVGFDATTAAGQAMAQAEDSIVALRGELADLKTELRFSSILLVGMFATAAAGAVAGVGYDTVPGWLRYSVVAASAAALLAFAVRAVAHRARKWVQPQE